MTTMTMVKRRKIRSATKQKILLLLQAGLVLGFSRSHQRRKFVFYSLPKEWQKIDRQLVYRSLREFYRDRLVSYLEKSEKGLIEIVLTEEGKRRVLEFNIDNLTLVEPAKWDGQWRVVLSDIPETKRRGRDALRHKLKELGFVEWQKSVFVYPHHCRDEIDFVVEFFELRPYVRYAEFINPTNEAELKLRFNL